jgi:acyl-CoA thioesterase FadM
MIPKNAQKIAKPTVMGHKCFGCSENNPHGLNLDFYYHDNKIYSTFTPSEYHGGWGKILHGGLSATLCDESLGWLSMCISKSIVITKELNFKYLKPIHIYDTLTIISVIDEDNGRSFRASSTILNSQNQICIQAKANMVKVTNRLASKLNIMSDSDIEIFSTFIDGIQL